MKRLIVTLAAALVGMVMAAPVEAQNCQTFYNPAFPGAEGDKAYDCYRSYVWHQQQGSWCARDWYRECLHKGYRSRSLWAEQGAIPVFNPNEPASGNNLLTSLGTGWIFGYRSGDTGMVSQRVQVWHGADMALVSG